MYFRPIGLCVLLFVYTALGCGETATAPARRSVAQAEWQGPAASAFAPPGLPHVSTATSSAISLCKRQGGTLRRTELGVASKVATPKATASSLSPESHACTDPQGRPAFAFVSRNGKVMASSAMYHGATGLHLAELLGAVLGEGKLIDGTVPTSKIRVWHRDGLEYRLTRVGDAVAFTSGFASELAALAPLTEQAAATKHKVSDSGKEKHARHAGRGFDPDKPDAERLSPSMRLARAQVQLSGAGFSLSGQPERLALNEGEVRSMPIRVRPGACYVVSAFGGQGLEDVDAGLFDEAGDTLDSDVDPGADTANSTCIAAENLVEYRLRAHDGSGPVLVAIFEKQMQHWPSWSEQVADKPQKTWKRKLGPERLYERVAQSVYTVRTDRGHQGSAIAIAPHTLMTNCHVVEWADSVQIEIAGDKVGARVLAADPTSDRCLLNVDDDVMLSPVKALRSAEGLKPGERVFAIGAPQGFAATLSEGLVSAAREMRDVKVIQITAPISPGSSGGGLFDAYGNLVGVTTAQVSGAQNLNFAIAADAWWEK